MKSKKKSNRKPSGASASNVRSLQAQQLEARKRSKEAKKQAREAKAQAKEARRLFKEARKVAKRAKAELGALTKKLRKLLSDSEKTRAAMGTPAASSARWTSARSALGMTAW